MTDLPRPKDGLFRFCEMWVGCACSVLDTARVGPSLSEGSGAITFSYTVVAVAPVPGTNLVAGTCVRCGKRYELVKPETWR